MHSMVVRCRGTNAKLGVKVYAKTSGGHSMVSIYATKKTRTSRMLHCIPIRKVNLNLYVFILCKHQEGKMKVQNVPWIVQLSEDRLCDSARHIGIMRIKL